MARKTIDELLGGEKRFGLLTVVGEGKQHKAAGSVGQTTRTIRFRCDCGSVVDLRPSSIRYGKRSCGCAKPEPVLRAVDPPKVELGARFNRWTVVGDIVSRPRKRGGLRLTALCRCDCGTESCVWIDTLRRNTSKSCGCYRSEVSRSRQTSHGQSRIGKVGRGIPEYTAWMNMIRRCHNPNHPQYPGYGRRGIAVCDEWRNGFAAFLRDMGRRPSSKHSIDRIEVNGNYELSNCRWATGLIQARNTRRNRFVEFDGRRMTVAEAAEMAGVPNGNVHSRLNLGWDIARALSTPIQTRPSRIPKSPKGMSMAGCSASHRLVKGKHTNSDIRRIFRLQKGRCGYCRSKLRPGMHRDHVVAIANGGTNFARNMQLLCEECNRRKASKSPEDFAREMGLLI